MIAVDTYLPPAPFQLVTHHSTIPWPPLVGSLPPPVGLCDPITAWIKKQKARKKINSQKYLMRIVQ